MKQLTLEEYTQHFPDKGSQYDLDRFEYICTLDFAFDDVQEFLNNKGLELQIKEVRFKATYDNSNGRHDLGYDSLSKVIVAVPAGTVLPDVLPYDGDKDIRIGEVFKKLVSKQILLGK